MKKINLLAGMMVLAGMGLTSCSSDDSSDNTNNVGIAGTYDLIEVNTETETDFNQDGTASWNQMDESNCYNSSKIVLNDDNTFVYDINSILVNETAGTFACSDDTFTGIWEIVSGSGNAAVLTATYENANGQDVTIALIKDGNQIIVSDFFGEYPDRNAQGGAFYNNGEVELVFEK